MKEHDSSEDEGTIKVQFHDKEPNKANPLIQEEMSNDVLYEDIENVDVISSPNIDVSDFLHIEEGKWEIDGHPFDGDLINDIDEEYDAKFSIPFL